MKTLRFMRPNCEANRFSDAKKIVNAFAAYGFEITHEDAVDAWREYSSASRHRWLLLDGLSAGAIYARLEQFFEELPAA